MKKNIVCLFIVFILVSFGSLFAQTSQELRIGSFLSGNLNRGQEIWYSVRTTQAGLLVVEGDSSIDTYLEAYDAQRNFITEDDDGAGYPNPRIRIIAQANTTYLFKLRAFSGDASGSFRIFADLKPITELRAGTPINGTIASGSEFIYSVRATQNGYLTVETSGDTDTYLTAYDEFYNYITEDDDGTGTINARIRIRVSNGKNYIFALRGYGSSTTGAFRIQANSQGYPTPTALNVGSFVSGNISYGDDLWYSVRATQNGFLTIETSSNTSSYYSDYNRIAQLEAYDDAYNYLMGDDGSVYPNVRIRMMVTAGKTYYFNLRGPDLDTSNAFRLFASFQTLPAPTPLTIGNFLSGNIASGEEFWYSARPARNGTLVVETTGSTDTFLDAYDGSYNLITSNDDGGENTNARIELTVQANQTYIFMLRGFGGYSTGPYRIFVSLE